MVLHERGQRESVLERMDQLGYVLVEEVESLGILRIRSLGDAAATPDFAEIEAVPGVLAAEPNGYGQAGGSVKPNDTHFREQWHLENTGQTGGTPGADIEARAAWQLQRGSRDIVVAVLDTGIDFDHPEFQGRLLRGYDTANDDEDPSGTDFHGVLVTGLLAAATHNDFGVSGVDWHCKIMPIQVIHDSGFGTIFDLIEGIEYASSRGADVISMSLINFPQVHSLEVALEAAKNSGCILLACGGNSGIGNADTSWPGASPHTISIGWTDLKDRRAINSGTGQALDFVAPGLGVRTCAFSHSNVWFIFSGCSAATPIAAGIVSLMLAERPGATQDEVYAWLQAGAEDQVGPPNEDTPGRDDFFGHGRLNAYRSLSAIPSPLGSNHCTSEPNSTGARARIQALGSLRVADNDFHLRALGLPPVVPALVFVGGSPAQVPFGPGNLCVSGPLQRVLPKAGSGACGIVVRQLDLSSPQLQGLATPGATLHFQAWFPDPDAGPGGFNLTNGVEVTFE